MARYTVEIYGYGIHKNQSYIVDAPNDDAMRRIVIQRYGYVLNDPRTGLSIYKEGKQFDYGHIKYHVKRWYWSNNLGSGWDFEINPATGGKMNRYIEGYEVRYVTKSGTPVKKNLKYEGIEFTRFALMNYDTYKDAKRNFTLYKAGKKLGTLTLAPNGKWLWTSASGSKYYVYRENGQISSQKR